MEVARDNLLLTTENDSELSMHLEEDKEVLQTLWVLLPRLYPARAGQMTASNIFYPDTTSDDVAG